MQEISKGYIPATTAKSTAWDVKVFQDSKSERNQRVQARRSNARATCWSVPILFKLTFGYLAQVRKQNGQPYHPRSILLILSVLQWRTVDSLTFLVALYYYAVLLKYHFLYRISCTFHKISRVIFYWHVVSAK